MTSPDETPIPLSNALVRLLEVPLKLVAGALFLWPISTPLVAAAGKTTVVGVSVRILVSVSIAISAGLVALLGRTLSQSKRLREQRDRIAKLEAENRDLRSQLANPASRLEHD